MARTLRNYLLIYSDVGHPKHAVLHTTQLSVS
jgi:hypothetical protein